MSFDETDIFGREPRLLYNIIKETGKRRCVWNKDGRAVVILIHSRTPNGSNDEVALLLGVSWNRNREYSAVRTHVLNSLGHFFQEHARDTFSTTVTICLGIKGLAWTCLTQE